MRLGIYGGTFNPPHIGHIRAASSAVRQLALDRLLIVPAGIPPHKDLPPGTPTGVDRMQMARLSFDSLPNVAVSDMEIREDGVSYTAKTLNRLRRQYPDAGIFLIMGTDMYLTLETWRNAAHILQTAVPAVLSRSPGEAASIKAYAEKLQARYNVKTRIIDNDVTEISSTALRQRLPNRDGPAFMDDATYGYIIKNRLYGAKPDWAWLRAKVYAVMKPRRIPHVEGCEHEALRLSEHWGADTEEACTAAILHDVTKHLDLADQLQLIHYYDIMTDNAEKEEVKLLHAKTGAAVAFYEYGASPSVYNAIFWHTTGRADMTLLEKIIYIADYIEPSRDFAGLDLLRSLAYSDLDKAIIKGLQMSIEDMRSRGITPHLRTQEALDWLITHSPQ